MSVLIKGMEMPVSCRYCEFRHMSITGNAFCTAAHETIGYMAERTKRLDSCPLIPVPPHGRLIDADALKTPMYFACMGVMAGTDPYSEPLKVLEAAPTIIEAEEGER